MKIMLLYLKKMNSLNLKFLTELRGLDSHIDKFRTELRGLDSNQDTRLERAMSYR